MSEVLVVAKALSQSKDSELERIIGIRLMNSSSFKDFFDFATALLKPQNLKGAVAGLSANQIIAFDNLLQGKTTAKDKKSLEVLAKLFLVTKQDKAFKEIESAKTIFRQLVNKQLIESLKSKQDSETQNPASDYSLIDPLAGIGAFETVQALTELVIDLEHRFVPEVARGSVGLPELKRLANFLGRDNDYSRRLYSLAQISGLVVLHQKRWRVGANYDFWISSDIPTRWAHLAQSWLKLIGHEFAEDLAEQTNLQKAIAETFPLANEGIASHMSNLVNLAELIGLTAAYRTSSWFEATMEGKLAKAKELISVQLPAIQNKIIVQADLTLISTGPLDTKTELLIRRFADIERIGVASSYRMNQISLSYGMETGLTADDIRKTLKSLSGKELPQPVDYTIKETDQRFGRLTIHKHDSGSLLQAKDPILLTAIQNHSDLKLLSFKKLDDLTLSTRFDQEIVYYQLRDCKFAAIAVDESGKVISNWSTPSESAQSKNLHHSIKMDIMRWREHEKRLGENPQGDDIIRSLELAIKNKATVKVTINDKKTKREFTLFPTGLANGRLRAKDKKADCERVLPVSSIVSVVIG